jgi:hypothetical protein
MVLLCRLINYELSKKKLWGELILHKCSVLTHAVYVKKMFAFEIKKISVCLSILIANTAAHFYETCYNP